MNTRTPKAASPDVGSSATPMLLLEFEMPKTMAFEAFAEQLNADLAELEERFSDFVTRNSLVGSIGR